MEIVEIRRGVFAWLSANKTANAGFVATERGVIVVDTLNTPDAGRKLASAIKARTQGPIIFVINTHHHYDHVFGNQAFDAPVVAHRELRPLLSRAIERDLMPLSIAARLSKHPEDRWLVDELEVVYPHLTFQQQLVLELAPMHMILQHMGGHTPDSCIVDLPDEGVLFAGDLVFEGRAPYLRQAHIADTLEALRSLECLGDRIVIPGYGKPCDMNYVIRLRVYLEELRDTVQDMIAQGLGRGDVLDSDRLPDWWTQDRPELIRANVVRIYNELERGPPPA
jgi:glyoxylase-like metal-dependent hydrolase (beta-lactamase superfamily II)